MEAKPINIKKYLEKEMFNRIHRVGIELEGAWTTLPDGMQPHRDGSIAMPPKKDSNGYTINWAVGEIPSDPLEPNRFRKWMKKFYPQHVNETCGLHVHMSFTNMKYYQQLMEPEYTATVLAYLEDWGHNEKIPKSHTFWSRIKGDNEYCRALFHADAQARATHKDYDRTKPGHRYTVINYCFAQHETFECRVLPMFDNVETAISAVERVLDITNATLLATAKKESRQAVEIRGNNQPYKDSYTDYV